MQNLDLADRLYIEECVTIMDNDGVSEAEQDRWLTGAVAELERESGQRWYTA
jgi:carotenoid cleavage dioxygenase-like enzyme